MLFPLEIDRIWLATIIVFGAMLVLAFADSLGRGKTKRKRKK